MNRRLEDGSARRILVVGGSGGIGLALTRKLIECGHRVTAVSRRPDDSGESPQLTHIPLDVTKSAVPATALPERLDGLVYAPGTINLKPFQRLTVEDFEDDYRINVLGAVRCLQSCLPALRRARDAASVVLFSSVAVRQGMSFHASIASAKGAVEGLTRALAAELAPGVRVNAIAPSLTDTRLAARLLCDDTKRATAARRHPLQRVGTPDDIASLAVHLLEPTGSWITGQVIHVDGGLSSLKLANG